MKKKIILTCLFYLLFNIGQSAIAEDIHVGLEPLPPLIIDDSTGLSVQILKEMEKISDLRFIIKIMPYNRAKASLKEGKIALMGHTPYQSEVKEFYDYAQELKWSVPTSMDIYSPNEADLKPEIYRQLKPIGTPRGNKEFTAEVLNIPLDNFYEGGIENLLKMLKVGRIKAFIFERASTMSSIKNLKISGLYYRHVLAMPAGFAVQNNSSGTHLKNQMDALIKKVDQNAIFKEYLTYMSLSEKGLVTF